MTKDDFYQCARSFVLSFSREKFTKTEQNKPIKTRHCD